MKKVFAIIAMITLLSIPAIAQANLLVNGSFEQAPGPSDPRFPGWDSSWGEAYNNWLRTATAPYATDGSWYAKCWWDGGIVQSVSVTGDQTYELLFDWWCADNAVGEGWATEAKIEYFNASDISVGTESFALTSLADGNWHEDIGGTTVAPTPAVTAELTFFTWADATTEPGNPTGWDNVRFDVIPEPSSLLLLGTGIMGMLSAVRKKKA
ncbi:MAG: PEP-CTERM sorting domain-containing protein [PVC group bacterium]|nr:PEP-CTERM sorting domain-containing protein [PVC group bacterium]